MFRDTANRSFWGRPELSWQLIPEGTFQLNRHDQKPRTADELLASIGAVVTSLAEPAHAPATRARVLAQRLAVSVGSLERRIAGMARAFDQAEVDRLAAKLVGLGSGPDDDNKEMREVAQKQLDALHDVERRLSAARVERARNLKSLEDLWHRLVGIQQASVDSGELAERTEKLRELLARIEVEEKTVSAAYSASTEAVSDAPTIERT